MYKKGLALAIREAISLGITSINEITDITGFRIYKELKKNLGLRVAIYLQENLKSVIDMGLKSNSGDDFLKFAGVKLFMDGSIGALTAAMKKPYQQSRNQGQILISERRLLHTVNRADLHSIQLMIHSIGDRATELVLKILGSKTLKSNPLRHRLEHLELLDTNHIKAISRQHLIASMQPNFLRWQSLDNMYYKNLGMRYKRMNCFKKMKMAGVKMVFGSDGMPIGPLYGISLVVNHPDGAVRLLPAEAIELYTEAPPYATFDENKKGKIREGYLADIVVFNKNPLVKQNLQTIKIIKIFIDGKPVDGIKE
jgi:predicted amidohydrolase YtcJ